MAGGSGFVHERQYSIYARAWLLRDFVVERGRVTASEVATFLGLHLSRAYRILDDVSEVAGLYKDGEFYVLMRP